ncbi:hypothetical protein AB1Y20_000407 [Prymnesium parvum]|uniref:Uncharacterized protein n=1 Tax=Prymnesium parvum TaxID=97485 RepID=A0AB34K5R8_PRYPA
MASAPAPSSEAFVLRTLRTSAQAAATAVRTKLRGRRVPLERARPPRRPAAPRLARERTAALPPAAARAALQRAALQRVACTDLAAQHARWRAYAAAALAGTRTLDQLAAAVAQLERCGCWLRRLGDERAVNEGYVLAETRHSFLLVSESRRARVLKANATFEMEVPWGGATAPIQLRGDRLVWGAR